MTRAAYAALLAGAIMTVACGGGDNSPTGPTSTAPPPPPSIPACQQNNSAIVAFGNRTTTGLTYDIFWDGSKVATIAPGQNSGDLTVAAGTRHTLQTRATNSNRLLCTAEPIPSQCSNIIHTCDV